MNDDLRGPLPPGGGVHHVGITVRDLDTALAFYTELLGGEVVFTIEQSGELLAAAVGVDDAALTIAFVRLGGALIELLDYAAPPGVPSRVSPYDPGAVHIAVAVPDLVAARDRLEAAGVDVSEPAWVPEGPTAGAGFSYCRDPDGVIVELYQTTPAIEGYRRAR